MAGTIGAALYPVAGYTGLRFGYGATTGQPAPALQLESLNNTGWVCGLLL